MPSGAFPVLQASCRRAKGLMAADDTASGHAQLGSYIYMYKKFLTRVYAKLQLSSGGTTSRVTTGDHGAVLCAGTPLSGEYIVALSSTVKDIRAAIVE
jgi:hypothetical protein